MKFRIAKIVSLLLVMSILFSVTSFAVDTDTVDVYTFEYDDRTIEINAEGLTYEQAQQIADRMVYGESDHSTYATSIFCLFGHKLDMTVAFETTHRYYADNPRCLKKTYEVEYCTRSSCSYSNATLTSSVRIYCCEED